MPSTGGGITEVGVVGWCPEIEDVEGILQENFLVFFPNESIVY